MERFWSKVETGMGCWVWTASKNGMGYGTFALNGRTVMAHRAAWELLIGVIPAGAVLDHLCRNKQCVNPSHLEPVTQKQNLLRAHGMGQANARKTHCPAGHPYAGSNLYTAPSGRRLCRACQRARATAPQKKGTD